MGRITVCGNLCYPTRDVHFQRRHDDGSLMNDLMKRVGVASSKIDWTECKYLGLLFFLELWLLSVCNVCFRFLRCLFLWRVFHLISQALALEERVETFALVMWLQLASMNWTRTQRYPILSHTSCKRDCNTVTTRRDSCQRQSLTPNLEGAIIRFVVLVSN